MNVRNMSLGAIKGTGLPRLRSQFKGHKQPVTKAYVHRGG